MTFVIQSLIIILDYKRRLMTYEETIILRVDEDTRRWLEDTSKAAGVSISTIVRLIMNEVRVSGTIQDGKITWKDENNA